MAGSVILRQEGAVKWGGELCVEAGIRIEKLVGGIFRGS